MLIGTMLKTMLSKNGDKLVEEGMALLNIRVFRYVCYPHLECTTFPTQLGQEQNDREHVLSVKLFFYNLNRGYNAY